MLLYYQVQLALYRHPSLCLHTCLPSWLLLGVLAVISIRQWQRFSLWHSSILSYTHQHWRRRLHAILGYLYLLVIIWLITVSLRVIIRPLSFILIGWLKLLKILCIQLMRRPNEMYVVTFMSLYVCMNRVVGNNLNRLWEKIVWNRCIGKVYITRLKVVREGFVSWCIYWQCIRTVLFEDK